MLFHKCAKNSICSTTVGNATVIPGSDIYYNGADQIMSSRVLVDKELTDKSLYNQRIYEYEAHHY